MTDLDRLKAAFKQLRTQGYLARVNVPGCGGMGCCPMFSPGYKGPNQERWDKAKKKVFITAQRAPFTKSYAYPTHVKGGHRNFEPGPNLPLLASDNTPYTMFLHWEGDGDEIVAALRQQELPTAWNGSSEMGIGVQSHAHWVSAEQESASP